MENEGYSHDFDSRFDRLEALLAATAPAAPEPLPFTADLVEQFLVWSEIEQHNTSRWVRAQRRYLTWWRGKLPFDLRAVVLEEHILPALDGAAGGRTPRIAVLKRFYSWLRIKRLLITPAQDPTLERLRVPQSSPAQWRIVRSVDQAQFDAIRQQLPAFWRVPLDVLGGTGWHFSELERFTAGGEIRDGALTCPSSKSGPPLRTRVTARVRRQAAALLQRGTLSEKRFRMALRVACELAGVELRPGGMRHSVATHAVDSGDSVAAVSTFLGHKSERTTRRFYTTHACAKRVKTLR